MRCAQKQFAYFYKSYQFLTDCLASKWVVYDARDALIECPGFIFTIITKYYLYKYYKYIYEFYFLSCYSKKQSKVKKKFSFQTENKPIVP